jgi:hypothetical protein
MAPSFILQETQQREMAEKTLTMAGLESLVEEQDKEINELK